ncbi:MAG: hypothetical protein HY429_03790 [Candidatus Levybacteria bacterium]|nr:hypothetical protein [Candidatus Levybacteria bacterium]
MNISFDLDGIFVDTPPFVPKKIIDILYRERSNQISYRIPSKFEQHIRKMSHIPLLRPPIKDNIATLRVIKKNNTHSYHLITSRFGFLNEETDCVLKTYNLHNLFHTISINKTNNQPHLFKHAMIKQLHIKRHVDDELILLEYLAKIHQNVLFFWLNKKQKKILRKNLYSITNLADVLQK